MVFLFPVKRREWSLTLLLFLWCLIQTMGKVAKETEEGLQETEISEGL